MTVDQIDPPMYDQAYEGAFVEALENEADVFYQHGFVDSNFDTCAPYINNVHWYSATEQESDDYHVLMKLPIC